MSVNAVEEKAELRVNAQEEQLHRQWLEAVERDNERDDRGVPCADCSVNTADQYMVRDSVWWDAVNANPHSEEPKTLCLKCLGTRLGRTLWWPADFTDAPCNAWLLAA